MRDCTPRLPPGCDIFFLVHYCRTKTGPREWTGRTNRTQPDSQIGPGLDLVEGLDARTRHAQTLAEPGLDLAEGSTELTNKTHTDTGRTRIGPTSICASTRSTSSSSPLSLSTFCCRALCNWWAGALLNW